MLLKPGRRCTDEHYLDFLAGVHPELMASPPRCWPSMFKMSASAGSMRTYGIARVFAIFSFGVVHCSILVRHVPTKSQAAAINLNIFLFGRNSTRLKGL